MKIGEDVRFFVPEAGFNVRAMITDIVGVGETKKKVLNLQYTDEGTVMKVEGVYHYDDGAEGEPFWINKGERAPIGWEEEELEPGIEVPVIEPVEEEKPAKKSTTKKKKGR